MAAAAEAFDEALHCTPDALAHAGLAMASAEMHLRFASAGEVQAWGEAARTQAQRAPPGPQPGRVHQALAAVYGKTEFEWDKIIQESHRALELNPRLEPPDSFLARAFYHLGLLEAADRKVREALALDPENRTEPIRAQGIVAVLEGRFAEAVPLLEEVRRISGKPSSIPTPPKPITTAVTSQGARPCSRSSAAPPPHPPRLQPAPRSPASGRPGRAGPGRGSGARSGGGELHGPSRREQPGRRVRPAGTPYRSGDPVRRAAETGFPCHPWYVHDPLLAPLRDHPEFERFLQGLREAQRSAEDRFLRR